MPEKGSVEPFILYAQLKPKEGKPNLSRHREVRLEPGPSQPTMGTIEHWPIRREGHEAFSPVPYQALFSIPINGSKAEAYLLLALSLQRMPFLFGLTQIFAHAKRKDEYRTQTL